MYEAGQHSLSSFILGVRDYALYLWRALSSIASTIIMQDSRILKVLLIVAEIFHSVLLVFSSSRLLTFARSIILLTMTRRPSFMDRGSFAKPNMRASVLLSGNKEQLTPLADLSLLEFDASLGCPLATYEDATLALVGGKALQCWRLMRHGLPVPPAFVIPTYVYSLHVGEAGVADLINEVFSCNLSDDTAREELTVKLETIRTKITSTPLNPEVIDNLKSFLHTLKGKSVSVRSSASAEDLGSQSFAGQYDTYLYKITVEEVCDSIKSCWASMFKVHILDYASKPVFLDVKVGDDLEPEVFTPGHMKPPHMGVLIMKMVEAKSSGVCFSKNLWGKADEIMVEAVLGQGEGLVGGEITPDRYVVGKYTSKLCFQELTPQTHKFVRSSNMDGVEKVALAEPFVGSVLSPRNIKALTMAARAIEEFYNRPQDIEFSIDEDDTLFILQSRPITTLESTGALSFIPPGEGFWTFDPTHFPRPASPWLRDNYGFQYAAHNSRRTGCMIKDIKFRFVHQFGYSQPDFLPPSEALERAAEAYWSKKLYEDDYREFTDFFRPECEALQDELQSVNPSSLSHRALGTYVARCFDLTAEFWKRHHTYTFPAFVVVGDYMNRMAEMTGKDEMDTLALLESASPESRGLLNHEDPLLADMYDLLTKSDKAMELLQSKDAGWALDCLFHLPDELGDAMRKVKIKYGWRLAGGYDLVTPAMIETPDFFLKTLYMGTQEDPNIAKAGLARVRKLADEWKSILPEEKHAEFEEILDVGRRFFRMRDERGLATDLSGVGLCRRGILEGGRRLVDQGVIYRAEHLCVATKNEAIALLRGDLGSLAEKGVPVGLVEIPTPRELERRFEYIATADPNLIPRALGTPPPPPNPMDLPPNIRRTMGAVHTGLLRGVWDEGQEEADEVILASDDVVKGVSASMGQTEGPVCLVTKDGDLQKVQKGDIVVTYSCSASFNVVIGLCSGICTDYGGMLSHAAIVAREYGIPAVVGSQHATKKFKDGDIVRIDSSTGKVTRVKRMA